MKTWTITYYPDTPMRVAPIPNELYRDTVEADTKFKAAWQFFKERSEWAGQATPQGYYPVVTIYSIE